MNANKTFFGFFLFFICVGIAVLACNGFAREESQKSATASAETQTAPKKLPKTRVIAYYFHGHRRCGGCSTIEKYSKEAIEQYFEKELEKGTLQFKEVNTDIAENKHYIQDFQLYTRSLVLVLYKGEKAEEYKNLKDVWTHVRNREKFDQYVKDETEEFLKKVK